MGFKEILPNDPNFKKYADFFIAKKEEIEKANPPNDLIETPELVLTYPLQSSVKVMNDTFMRKSQGEETSSFDLLTPRCYYSKKIPSPFARWSTCTLPHINSSGMYIMQFGDSNEGPLGKLILVGTQLLLNTKEPNLITGAENLIIAIADVTGDGIDDIAVFTPSKAYQDGDKKIEMSLKIFAGTTDNEHYIKRTVNMMEQGVATFKVTPSPKRDIEINPELFKSLTQPETE